MAIDPVGAALAIAGLLAAFKGAIDSCLLIESLFDKDSGLKDLAARFHVERLELKEWGARFNLNDPRAEECLFYYETDEKRKLIFEILERINTRLTNAQDLLKYHTRSDPPQKGFKIRSPFNKRHADAQGVLDSDNGDEGERNRIRWAIKNKAKFEEVVTTLKTHYENLVRLSKRIAILQLGNWCRTHGPDLSPVLWLTRIDETSLHTRAQQQRQEGTGRWLFGRTEFEHWLSGKVKDILWIHAIRK
jgi:hypothetical protein